MLEFAYCIGMGILIISFALIIYYLYILNLNKSNPLFVSPLQTALIQIQNNITKPSTALINLSTTSVFYTGLNGSGTKVEPKDYDVYLLGSTDSNGILSFAIQSINAPQNTILCVFSKSQNLGINIGEYKHFIMVERVIPDIKAYLTQYPNLTNTNTGLTITSPNTNHMIMIVPVKDVASLKTKTIQDCVNFIKPNSNIDPQTYCNFNDPDGISSTEAVMAAMQPLNSKTV